MQTFESDVGLFTRPNAGDDQLFVVFYMGTMDNEARTVAEGRRIVDDVECVRIMIPGDKNNIIDRPVTTDDRRRWPKQYQMFKDGAKEDEQISGTRLRDWPYCSRGQVEEMTYLGIKTVEQLAVLRDDVISRSMGFRTLRDNAVAWLANAKDSAMAAQQAKTMSDQAARITGLEDVIKDQAGRIEALVARLDKTGQK
jgi:hypothetical protein